ncbi:MAG: hypothetical protein NT090_11340 [Acidobacteria bacterium]|nr:hypothetical protein [Acidobacteriota bacterium]
MFFRRVCFSAAALFVLLAAAPVFAQRVLTLSAPDGGEVWPSGNRLITWTRGGTGWLGGDTLKIEYSSNAGGTWVTLAASTTASANQYSWNVDGFPASPLYRVRLTCNEYPAATDASPSSAA